MRSYVRLVVAACGVAVVLSCSTALAQSPKPANIVIDEAVKKAKASGRVVFLDFSASW